jgi:hypothetical protein
MKRLIAALGFMLLASPALAAVLATGMALTITDAHCYVANVGTKPVMVSSVTAIDINGAVASVITNNCTFPGPISPGLTCNVAVSVGSGTFNVMRCEVVASSKSSIRATMQTFGNTGPGAVLEAR